jgi:hypothetical protein
MTSLPRTLLLAGLLLCAPVLAAGPFPDIPGYAKQDEPRKYDPDSLFEYINGDAFSYINYGFEQVTVQDYESEAGPELTIDIYRHSGANNGYGIYSHERPADAEPLAIGGEGYYDRGALNFFKGEYYVKLRAHGTGDDLETLMKKAAAEVAGAIEGEAALPATAAAFPDEGMIANSLRYMGGGFLGHGFLHSAFTAEYQKGEGKLQVFIIEAEDDEASSKMLEDYLALVERKGGERSLEDGIYRFKDPYHSSRGAMNIKRAGKYLFGLFSDDKTAADSYLKSLEAGLEG